MAVLLVRYSEPFLKWTREELKQMDQRTRKLMTMHKAEMALTDYMCKKRGKLHNSIEDSVGNYTEKYGGRLTTTTRNNTNKTRFKRTKITRKRKWEKATVWISKEINKRRLTRENLDKVEKGKS